MRFLPHQQPWIIFGNTASKSGPGSQTSAEISSSETSFETLGNVVISPADPEGMILISGGRFMMGADSQTDSDAEANEGPVQSVTLKGPFYISDHEVIVGEYKACVDAGGCTQSPVQEPSLTT